MAVVARVLPVLALTNIALQVPVACHVAVRLKLCTCVVSLPTMRSPSPQPVALAAMLDGKCNLAGPVLSSLPPHPTIAAQATKNKVALPALRNEIPLYSNSLLIVFLPVAPISWCPQACALSSGPS